MKHILTLIIMIAGCFTASAQDNQAKTILDKTVAKIKSYPAVEITFDLTMENKAENVRENHTGKAYMKDKMYRIEVMDVINYFDGSVIYTYMPESEEVNIKNPEEEEEDFLNPTILFDIHNQKFNQKLIENKDGIAYIELTPKTPHKQIAKIEVWVDTKKETVQKVISHGKDGNDLIIVIKELKQPEKPLDIKFFQFDTTAHPEVDVIDLR